MQTINNSLDNDDSRELGNGAKGRQEPGFLAASRESQDDSFSFERLRELLHVGITVRMNPLFLLGNIPHHRRNSLSPIVGLFLRRL